MTKTRLFIEDQEVELTDAVQFAITKQFEDIFNPTKIINDWSKTVSIPFTSHNNKLFGYICNQDKLNVYSPSNNYISGNPSSIKIWDGSTYVNTSLVNGEIVCPLTTDYLQVGFQYQNWTYSQTINYKCNNDTHTYQFTYSPETDYRFEFSFRCLTSDAPNNEVFFVQWDLHSLGLVAGREYIINFSHRKSGNNYIIYNYSISNKPQLVGINFDPLQKLSFRLEWNNDIIMTGYAKLNDIKHSKGNGVYNLTLFGELGKVFQKMQKITFDQTVEDSAYLINGAKYVDDNINRTLVYNSWNSAGQTHEQLYPKLLETQGGTVNHPAYNINDIIGFAPNNAFSEGFDYKTFQSSSTTSTTWADYLGDSFTSDTGINPSSVIPDGLLPREVGEYRSYLQLPYIYWNKLFKIFQNKAEELTGYEFDLDNEWFNTANPYWYKLVYMLKPLNFSNKDSVSVTNTYKSNEYSYTWTPRAERIRQGRNMVWVYYYEGFNTTNVTGYQQVTEGTPILVNGNTFQIDDRMQLTSNGNINVRFIADPTGDYTTKNYIITKRNAYKIYLTYTGVNSGRTITKTIVMCADGVDNENVINACNTADSVYIMRQTVSSRYYDSSLGRYVNYFEYSVPIPQFTVNTTIFDTQFTVKFSAEWVDKGMRKQPINFYNVAEDAQYAYNGSIAVNTIVNLSMDIKTGLFFSGSRFNLNDLWNKEFNIFEEILKYCKMYRINIMVDDINKKIKFTRTPKYFKHYEILDWTDKVDKSKDYVIKPITFDNKYVIFNYDDSDTNIGKEYKEMYGVNYGEYKLITDYNFNEDSSELFEGVKQSIVSTDNVLSWLTLARHRVSYTLGAEIFVNNKDKDKKQVDVFGSFFFHNGLANFDVGNNSELIGVNISDDSVFQGNNSTFFYTYIQTDRVYTTTYPKLDIVCDNNMCLFNIPKHNYTYIQNYTGKDTIYTNFWQNYINERYNIQNKIITCYLRIKPLDFINFDFNKFIKIDNQVCLLNKIYDYDVTSTDTTKVDLITIQNIGGYIDDSFVESIDTLTVSSYSTTYINYHVDTTTHHLASFSSVTDVTFNNNQKSITMYGVEFTISGNDIYYKAITKYVDYDDIVFNLIIKNNHYTEELNIVRYSTYPYPKIIIETTGGTEVSSIYPGSRVYKLKWSGTETEGLENKPTVTIDSWSHATGSATIANDWVENQVMIQEGDDEWFRNEYEVTLNTNMTNYSNTYITVTIVDKEGWHETRNYPISL